MSRYKRPISQTDLREKNLSTILYCLREEAPTSRANLASLTQLNKSTVSSLTEELLAAGVIEDVGLAESDGGRPGKLLALNAPQNLSIGVEFAANLVSVVVTNLVGEIQARCEAVVDHSEQEQMLQTAVTLINKMLSTVVAQNGRVLGIGVALPGVVDGINGRLVYSPNLQWRQVAIRQYFESHFDYPINIENNANAAALGEHFFGAAQQIDDFIFVSVGKGIGAGLFLNGDLFHGVRGMAGEIGQAHVVQGQAWLMEQDGRRWDSFANKPALLTLVQDGLDGRQQTVLREWIGDERPLTLQLINRAAVAEDVFALNCLKEVGERIGLGIANLIHFIDPALILLGGEMAAVGTHLLPHIASITQQSDLIEREYPVKVALSQFREDAILIGASTLMIQMALNEPRTYLLSDTVSVL